MNEQVETQVVELSLEDLDQVQGGIICRKAGGTQQEFLTGGDESIIAIL